MKFSQKINITFWDSFAEEFENSLTDDLEEPIIVIIASGKISKWNGKSIFTDINYRIQCYIYLLSCQIFYMYR